MDLDAYEAQRRRSWSEGDHPAVGRLLEPAAEALVDRGGVRPGERVLDAVTGSGHVAIGTRAG